MVTVGARARGGLLRDLLRLAPGEETRVGLLVLYALAALGGVAALAVDTGQALFLGSQSRAAIPLLFALPAVVVPGSAMLYHMLSARLRPSTLCSGTNSALIIGILLCRALLQTPAGARLPALLAVVGCCAITATLTMLQFWDLAGALFRAPEDKRSFGLLTGVGIIATTATGAFVVALSEAVAVQDFLFVVAASLAVCLVCAQSIRSLAGDDAPGTGTRNLDLSTTLRSFSRVALTRWIALLLIIGAVVGSLANFQFSLALHNAYEGHPEDVLRSLGLLALGTGLLAGLLQWQGTNRFMEALGVGPALRVLPGGLAAAAVALLLGGGGLAAAVLPRAVDRLLRPTLNNTALNVLLLPIPGDLRQRTRLVRDGVLTPLASGLAGLLLVFGAGLDLWTWSLPMLAFVIVWVALVPPARRQYMAALTENMRKRRLNLDTTTIDESDGTVRVLRAALAQPDETQVLHALQLIATAPRIQWDTEVCTLLEHPSPEVRVAALRHLGRPGNVAASTAIRGLFTTGDAAVQAAAIEAFCAVAGPAATAQVSGFLQVASPAIQGAALRGLMQHGGLFGILDAIPQLNGMLRSADPAMRLEGARVLGALRVHQHRLIPLFDDVSAEVQAGAIRAAGELCQPELVPYLIAKLGQKGIGPAAADALVQYGAGIEPLLGDVLGARSQPPEVRCHVPKILRRIGTPVAGALLLAHLREPDETVRAEVLRALAKLRETGGFAVREDAVREALNAELRTAYTLHVLHADLSRSGRDPLLQDAISTRIGRAQERIFSLLGVLYPGQAIESARLRLDWESGPMRAQAGALLANLIPRDIKDLLLPLLDAPTDGILEIARRRLDIPSRSPEQRLEELARDMDPWLRTCAVYRIGALRLAGLAGLVRAALADEDALVRETAMVALRGLQAPVEAR